MGPELFIATNSSCCLLHLPLYPLYFILILFHIFFLLVRPFLLISNFSSWSYTYEFVLSHSDKQHVTVC